MPEVKYVGLGALEAKARAAVQVAATQAATDFVRRSAAATPVKTGTLKSSIHIVWIHQNAAGVRVKVATGAEANEYAIYVHEGTGPHTITAKDGGVLAFNGHFAKSVRHPGTKPYLYMTRPLAQMAPIYAAFMKAAAIAEF